MNMDKRAIRLSLAMATCALATCAAATEIHHVGGDVLAGFVDGDNVIVCRSNATLKVVRPGSIDLLVVGGGGGGGVRGGGGGGGGGVVYTQSLDVACGTYEIVVGAGGQGATNDTMAACNGFPSVAFGVTALGGGGGGSYGDGVKAEVLEGHDGASGGGGGNGYFPNAYAARTNRGGSGQDGQGFSGGCSTNQTAHWYTLGGGGGGAGGPGTDAVCADNKLYGGCGGPGKLCEIYGSVYYGGGGGGGGTKNKQSGSGAAQDGGGQGGTTSSSDAYALCPGASGMPNTGGGGGGGSAGASGASLGSAFGGDGGSGIVIVRYRADATAAPTVPRGAAMGGEVKYRNHYEIHSFTNAESTFVLPSDTRADVLIVGGGGGGGCAGGGGGGGGVVQLTNIVLRAGTYQVSVGAGGTCAGDLANGTNGGDSSLTADWLASDFIAKGGGGGAYGSNSGLAGGSGGGGGGKYISEADGKTLGGAGKAGQGHAGGCGDHMKGQAAMSLGGGGGGAGAVGSDASCSDQIGGNGGVGLYLDYSGELRCYGSGGGGGSSTTDGKRSTAGEGAGRGGYMTYSGGVVTHVGGDGMDGLGGGGGGGCRRSDYRSLGGRGGCGTVIIRFRYCPNGLFMVYR